MPGANTKMPNSSALFNEVKCGDLFTTHCAKRGSGVCSPHVAYERAGVWSSSFKHNQMLFLVLCTPACARRENNKYWKLFQRQ